jgi:hypothetical protein
MGILGGDCLNQFMPRGQNKEKSINLGSYFDPKMAKSTN